MKKSKKKKKSNKKYNKKHNKAKLNKKKIHKKSKNSTSKKKRKKTHKKNKKNISIQASGKGKNVLADNQTQKAENNNEDKIKNNAKTNSGVEDKEKSLAETAENKKHDKWRKVTKNKKKSKNKSKNQEKEKNKNSVPKKEKKKSREQNEEDSVNKKSEKEKKLKEKSENNNKKERKKQNKEKDEKKKNKRKKHRILKFFLILIILGLLLCIAGIWIFAGLIFGWFGNNIDISKEDLQIKVSNSVIVDKNGEILADLSGDEKRKIITLEDMADYLPKAYVAIEDERFYEHKGIDIKRTVGAIANTLVYGESSYGGSTITQQLVKNITNDNESTGIEGIKRKVREWSRAYQVETMISKDQILELYLNILFVGANNLHGVELGAEYYFNKSAKDLDLAECAFMAGINHSPNAYNPYNTAVDNSEKIKNRTLTVLNKMKELGYITNEEEYNNAVAKVQAGLTFGTGNINEGTIYSYHTDAVISQVVEQVMEEKGLTEQMARNYVYSSGLTIYSTVDTAIQNRVEEEYLKTTYIRKGNRRNSDGTLLNEHTQSGMAIIDYKTGNVVAVAGGLGEKTESGWNRATQMQKQTGSSMKPLAVVAPGLEEKIITAATVYNDSRTRFGKNYEPKNYNGFKGLINIRSFIKTSQNIPAVKIMTELTPEKSLQYLENMGITSLNPNTDSVLSLALGGVTSGVSPLEMAAAYGTIANDGVYITPIFYTKVEDSAGNVVLTPKQENRRVISEQNAYIAKTIIQEPVKAGGTATYCAIQGMDVAAKTGTTDNSYDRWLCGFTPYYVAATWYGYDNSETVYNSGNPAGTIWDAIMTDIHAGLPSATFTRPEGIVEAKVCRTTGCLATSRCTDTYTEIFTQDNMPGECQGHRIIPKETLNLWTSLN